MLFQYQSNALIYLDAVFAWDDRQFCLMDLSSVDISIDS